MKRSAMCNLFCFLAACAALCAGCTDGPPPEIQEQPEPLAVRDAELPLEIRARDPLFPGGDRILKELVENPVDWDEQDTLQFLWEEYILAVQSGEDRLLVLDDTGEAVGEYRLAERINWYGEGYRAAPQDLRVRRDQLYSYRHGNGRMLLLPCAASGVEDFLAVVLLDEENGSVTGAWGPLGRQLDHYAKTWDIGSHRVSLCTTRGAGIDAPEFLVDRVDFRAGNVIRLAEGFYDEYQATMVSSMSMRADDETYLYLKRDEEDRSRGFYLPGKQRTYREADLVGAYYVDWPGEGDLWKRGGEIPGEERYLFQADGTYVYGRERTAGESVLFDSGRWAIRGDNRLELTAQAKVIREEQGGYRYLELAEDAYEVTYHRLRSPAMIHYTTPAHTGVDIDGTVFISTEEAQWKYDLTLLQQFLFFGYWAAAPGVEEAMRPPAAYPSQAFAGTGLPVVHLDDLQIAAFAKWQHQVQDVLERGWVYDYPLKFIVYEPSRDYAEGLLLKVPFSAATPGVFNYFYRIPDREELDLEETFAVCNWEEECWEVLTTGTGILVRSGADLRERGKVSLPLPEAVRGLQEAYTAYVRDQASDRQGGR